MFVKHIGLYFTGNAIAALLVFGREYSLELTATQSPSKTQLRERKHMKDYLKGMQFIHTTRNINNFLRVKPGQQRAVYWTMSLWFPVSLS